MVDIAQQASGISRVDRPAVRHRDDMDSRPALGTLPGFAQGNRFTTQLADLAARRYRLGSEQAQPVNQAVSHQKGKALGGTRLTFGSLAGQSFGRERSDSWHAAIVAAKAANAAILPATDFFSPKAK